MHCGVPASLSKRERRYKSIYVSDKAQLMNDDLIPVKLWLLPEISLPLQAEWKRVSCMVCSGALVEVTAYPDLSSSVL